MEHVHSIGINDEGNKTSSADAEDRKTASIWTNDSYLIGYRPSTYNKTKIRAPALIAHAVNGSKCQQALSDNNILDL